MSGNLEEHELLFYAILSMYINEKSDDGLEGFVKEIDFSELPDLPDEDDEFADEEWDSFVSYYFNDYENKEHNFYEANETMLDNLKAFEFLALARKADEWNNSVYGFGINLSEDTNAEVWNLIAWWAISTEIGEKIKTKFTKLVLKECETRRGEIDDRKHRLECDICFEAKQIHVCCSYCKGKLFCKRCYTKLNNQCPFCRQRMLQYDKDKEVRMFDIYRCEINPRDWGYIKSEDKEKWIENTEAICAEIREKHIVKE